MITVARAKRLLAVGLAVLLAVVAAAVLAQAVRAVVTAGTGADPSTALNEVPAIPDDLDVAVTWRGDPTDLGRPIEPATRRSVETALVRGLAQLDLAQRTGETGGLGTWFSGPALDRARRAPGGEGPTTWTAHRLEADFYSDDGSILTLTTDADLVRELPDATAWSTRETYRITVLLEDGNWRIRHLERVAVAPLTDA